MNRAILFGFFHKGVIGHEYKTVSEINSVYTETFRAKKTENSKISFFFF